MTLPYDLPWWGWAIAILGALWIGISKTGIAGLGVLAVAVFTLIFPARESTGIVLTILMVGDIVAVLTYRFNAEWRYLVRLAPFTVVGVVLGYFALGILDSHAVGRLIGAILLVIIALQYWRMRSAGGVEHAGEALRHNLWLTALAGVLAGFFTMVSNASGPIMIIYLLAMGLPKMAFMGTSAWFYFLLNAGKLPFSYNLGLITPQSLTFTLLMAPFAVIGGLVGYQILKRINQRVFEQLALILTAIAALRLVIG
jgi:uncharacterized membrane protein YfcA